jgi:hypothetical protein
MDLCESVRTTRWEAVCPGLLTRSDDFEYCPRRRYLETRSDRPVHAPTHLRRGKLEDGWVDGSSGREG